MTPYQIGYLCGGILGSVLGVTLVVRAFKRKTAASIGWGVFGGVIALAYLTTTFAKFSADNLHDDFRRGFTRGCEHRCDAEQGEPSLCDTYCDCQASQIMAFPDSERVIESMREIQSESEISPHLRARLSDVSTACMPPQLYDKGFMANCQAACAGSTCPQSCRCFLDNLREGMDPAIGTTWLMRNVDADPPTTAGEQRANAATQACAHLMGGG